VQAHTLGEVGILGTVLRVSSETILPIFIAIGSYLTDKQQKINWHSFFLHGVVLLLSLVLVIKKSTCIPFISFAAFKESVTLNLAQRSYNLAAIEGPYSLQRH